MGAIHDQAMHFVYQQVLQRLLERMTQGQRASLQLLIQRLVVIAGGLECIGGLKVMMVHSGSQDSSHSLAFLRAAQLSLAARSPSTFLLRVATARHSDMPQAALGNIERAFAALVVHDDPRVELLMVNGGEVRPFDARERINREQQQADRHAVLMAGQLTGGDPLMTLGHRHYLDLAYLHRLVAAWDGGVDVLVSGEPTPRRKRRLAGSVRMLRRAGLKRLRPVEAFPRSLFEMTEAVRAAYSPQSDAADKAPPCEARGRLPRFIAVDDLVHDPSCSNGRLLLDLLRFEHDEWAFAFPVIEPGNPLLRLHLHCLREEFIEAGGYQAALEEAMQRIEDGMKRGHLAVAQRDQMLDRWRKVEDLQQVRRMAGDFVSQVWGIGETQLVCMLFAPFVSKGRGLEAFLRRCHPGMLVAMPHLHRALQGHSSPDQVVQWLTSTSGLPLATLQAVYQCDPLMAPVPLATDH